ncbi:CBASS cGAMP-activated phospholipase [Flammeovirgaceae bacterium SG7u.111]|nr:CBASS cGAMP-activated phospholipase [Flammeovirgaceae bacterium SG7u.132]WPO38360.1 CBASS cGAMP-activated phospholipase [Flammeovirgaceae bacterium SG7u.111]
MPKYFRILSIDGGGIRGVLPGQVLCHVEKYLQTITQDKSARLSDFFDMVAGTSTGGILACAFLLPDSSSRPKFRSNEVVDLYLNRGEAIFDRPFFKKLRTLGGITDEKYPEKGLEKALEEYFGETKISQLLKPCVIPSYDVTRRKATFFRQHSAKKKGDCADFLVKDITRATSAAPTYFECANIKSLEGDEYAMIDGGIFANNPGLCAYADARRFYGKTASEMVIFSLGTGEKKKSYPYDKVKNWGLVQWPAPLIDIMMSSVAETVDFQLKQIYEAVEQPSQYLRVNETLPEWVNEEMDDANEENMRALQQFGDQVFAKHKVAIESFAKKYLVQDDGDDLIA